MGIKKLACVILAASMSVGVMAGCGNGNSKTENSNNAQNLNSRC